MTPPAIPDRYTDAEARRAVGVTDPVGPASVWPGTVPASRITDGDACPRLVRPDGRVVAYELTTRSGRRQCEASIEAAAVPEGADPHDVLVRAGDFWMDAWEATACRSPSETPLGDTKPTGEDLTFPACSVAPAAPLRDVTWFQAQQACANAGKRLCTNAEWQLAVAGTSDPGASDGSGGKCLTAADLPRSTGLGTACRSRFGAEDLIGNVWEWVADWQQAGPASITVTGAAAYSWPAGFADDGVYNLSGHADLGAAVIPSMPAAVLRGGSRSTGNAAGAFAYLLNHSPANRINEVGFRCCASR